MRKTIMSLIAGSPATAVIPIDRWYSAGGVDKNPVKPFGIYRLSGSGPGVTSRNPSREVRLELWVHDVPGSYLQIDGALGMLESTFNAVEHASAAAGESISQASFDSRSPDLDDQGFGTICKSTIYTLIGKGQ